MSGPEVLTPVQARMALPLGQTGRACYAYVPQAVVELEREPVSPPLVLIPVGPVSEGDGAPATVEQLRARVGGVALYGAALLPEGPESAPGVTDEGTKTRVALPALDRWILREAIVVKWRHADGRRGFATWGRSGRGRWLPGVAWWRGGDGRWSYGKHSGIGKDQEA